MRPRMTEPGPAMDTVSSRSAVDRMLYARSIAVIGASERMGYGGRLLSNLRVGGYKGAIYPVNPKYEKYRTCPPSRPSARFRALWTSL